MILDPLNPCEACPYVEGKEMVWTLSREDNTYYFWVQQVSAEVQLHPLISPEEVEIGSGVKLFVHKGLSKNELLYRLSFKKLPERFVAKPGHSPHAIFWTFGKEGGPSLKVTPLYRDKNISVHSWVDKKSYLAVIRTEHFNHSDFSFWSR